MSPKLPVVSGPEVIKILAKAGFCPTTQRGSHVKMRHPSGKTAIVPLHDELAPSTLRSVVKQAGLTVEEFITLLR
ncbi:MAG TPA: addiction module toxin, HicA family [Syntrophothermus lipocalidus]|uniref:YcfA family protein n=1 Tax=Syntrophothermus lipocalidus (strain DSM 12680 / TGB-C1) TaxID=643648 RepID=D7CNM8_SYNLT|nr:type II toxin-antitoxin system HicA family toxin [Syntrophothermus lipocalidus]ADI02313.1 YcfA family protein [Syntrophothermus lipocalidus DSM 12680]HHV76841.1 addiction module toxin, HicA family [Syntrophothermus lipocalidus]